MANRKHLAIFREPFLDLILTGEKTVESRFGKVCCAPHGKIQKGDTVLMKKAGGLVMGEFTVSRVESFCDFSVSLLEELSEKYSKVICSDFEDNFWENRGGSKYITLIHISKVKKYEKPFCYPKKDRRGWVIIKEYEKNN